MTFAAKLREIRAAAELTQERLAAESGLGLGTIRDYEQGKREPLLSTAFKLARALGVSVEAFAGCVEENGKRRGTPGPKRARGRPRKGK